MPQQASGRALDEIAFNQANVTGFGFQHAIKG